MTTDLDAYRSEATTERDRLLKDAAYRLVQSMDSLVGARRVHFLLARPLLTLEPR